MAKKTYAAREPISMKTG